MGVSLEPMVPRPILDLMARLTLRAGVGRSEGLDEGSDEGSQ